jgi:hypothetical protein
MMKKSKNVIISNYIFDNKILVIIIIKTNNNSRHYNIVSAIVVCIKSTIFVSSRVLYFIDLNLFIYDPSLYFAVCYYYL